MIVIKTNMEYLPETCDSMCPWYGSRPHPFKGWTEICELMCKCMDDDQEPKWIFDGDHRPEACPLLKINEEPTVEVTSKEHER